MEEDKKDYSNSEESSVSERDDGGRQIFRNGKWIDSDLTRDVIMKRLRTLDPAQRQALGKKCTLQNVVLDSKCEEVWKLVERDVALTYSLILEIAGRKISTVDRNVKYSITTAESSLGYTTGLSGGLFGKYTWGMAHVDNKPDVEGVVAEMVASFGRPTDSGVVPEKISKAKAIKPYFPAKNGMVSYISMAKESVDSVITSHDSLVEAVRPMVKQGDTGRKQVIKDLCSNQPALLTRKGRKGARLVAKGKRSMLVKAAPTRVDNLKHSYSDIVEAISGMTTALGSAKYGFGRMSRFHYDGIAAIDGAMRDKHEWLTDFVYQEADVYFVRTHDPNFALALMRVIEQVDDERKFAVVYESGNPDLSKIREVFEMKDGVCVKVQKKAVIGVGILQWGTFIKGMTSYYVSFAPYKKGHGHRSELVSSSIDARKARQEEAQVYDCYMYYGFIGSMKEGDKIRPSCRGRDGTIIFTNDGKMDRQAATLCVFNMVKHALLYPWLHSCFVFKVDGKHFYEGVREFKAEYDFSVLDKNSGIVFDFGDETAAPDAIDNLAAEVVSEAKIVEENKEEDDDEGLFAALDSLTET